MIESREMAWTIKRGEVVRRTDLQEQSGGGRQGGISPSRSLYWALALVFGEQLVRRRLVNRQTVLAIPSPSAFRSSSSGASTSLLSTEAPAGLRFAASEVVEADELRRSAGALALKLQISLVVSADDFDDRQGAKLVSDHHLPLTTLAISGLVSRQGQPSVDRVRRETFSRTVSA
jgi:hypothetical protein